MANIHTKKTESEKWMGEYLDLHGYRYEFEQDLGELTKPDYRIERRGFSAICEVKEFKTRGLMKYMDRTKESFAIRDTKDILLPVRTQIRAAARQLKPYKGLNVPLLIVLSNPHDAWIDLDDHPVIWAMYGDPQIALTKQGDGEVLSVHQTGRNGKLTNHHKHISAIVVLKKQCSGKALSEFLPGESVLPTNDLETESAFPQSDLSKAILPNYSYSCSVFENFSNESTPLPLEMFNAEGDSRWKVIDGQMTKVR